MSLGKDRAIEETKKLVTGKFLFGTLATKAGLGSSRSAGNIYEAKAPKELHGRIVEAAGIYLGHGEEKDTISLQVDEELMLIMPTQETVYSDSITDAPFGQLITPGDRLYVIAVKVEAYPIYIAVTIIQTDEMWMFDQIRSLYGKGNAIHNFYSLFKDNPEKKAFIINQLKEERHKRYDSSEDIIFDSTPEQMLKYAMCKETYSGEAQRAIEAMYRDSNAAKHKTEQKLSYLSKIASTYKNRVPVEKEKLEELLNARFYKMDSAKQQLVDFLVSNEHAKKRGFNILLVGGAGVGKTSLLETVADAYHVPSEVIPLNGMMNTLELEGLDSGYDSADAGRLVKAFAGHGTSEMVIGFDEIDKMNCHSKEGDPMNVLYRILLGKHEDKFLGCTISTENTIFIATANDIKNIPGPIINRFHAIIHMDDYSVEDKVAIAQRHTLPVILENFDYPADMVILSDETLRMIVINYCGDGGIRDLQHNLERVIRHKISCGRLQRRVEVSEGEVREILDPIVEITPAILFSRNRENYSEPVANAITNCLQDTQSKARIGEEQFVAEKKRQKLEFLLACKNETGEFIDAFDPVKFSEYLHENLFGMDKVIKEATVFYHTAFLQGLGMNTNLALCGGFGIGKTTIVKNIADAMGYHFVKISLNGIDEAKVLRGFSSTYVGSEPGRIIKGVKEAGSLKTVFQLDEIDKLKPEIAAVLLDLLDRDFTDNYLDVPVDFRQAIFIATANDWSNVPPVVRDRFIVVEVDGYTREEKSQIVSGYIIPRIEKAYGSSGVTVTLDPLAEKYLLETYCTSFGVRDAEKAMQRIVGSKLVDQCGCENALQVRVSREDVRKYIGAEPIPRGNFPTDYEQPGVSKALAVSHGNQGSAFAIETVLVDGVEGLEMTGLPREAATDSVKIAITCIKRMYPELLKDKHIHVHFGEGSVPKDGPSAGVALFMSILSAALDQPIMNQKPYDIAYTGELSLTGGVFAVGGVLEKIQAACDSGCSKVFIPAQNYEMLDQKKLSQFGCEIIPINSIQEAVQIIFPGKQELFMTRTK